MPCCDDKPTVFLDQWRIIRLRERTRHLVGIAYGHPRLREGARIVSSIVVFVAPDHSFAETLNTFYRLQTPGEGPSPSDWAERIDYFLKHAWGTRRLEEDEL